ncbi:MAG TPA: CPBP family intramembrane glutamic endopeptidase [Actinomycetes bacterium]|nr:CPBP family intramembrane glutamic endopeptidase [Actinomycetes bacterium]
MADHDAAGRAGASGPGDPPAPPEPHQAVAAGARGAAADGPPRLPDRPVLRAEVWLVLGLSLLASAAYAVLSLFEAPLRGQTVALFANAGLARQLLGIGFDLVPVALVVHLLHRSGERVSDIGLDARRLGRDFGQGVVLAAVVGAVGVVLYAVAVTIGANRMVAAAPPAGHWWTSPVLLLGSVRSALLEEVVVCGYLLRRLDQLGWRPGTALAASALLRGAYHLYQGFGGFVGNVALGLLFGRIYQARGRLLPLVVAHALLDTAAGFGYLVLRGHVSWLPG